MCDMDKELEQERLEEKRIEDLEYEQECREERENDNPAWDVRDGDFL